jgi:transcriptional regulator with XRE-family HTH domain
MSILLTPDQIEAKAAACGKSMAEVCREAAIAPSTFSRWRRGETEPTLGVYRRLCEAVGVPVSAAAPVPPSEVAA